MSSLLLVLFSISASLAAPYCPPDKSLLVDNEAINKYVLKTSQIGKPDRQTARQFASGQPGETEKDVARRYAGSGDLSCGDAFGQAQLVLKDNLILTSGHMMRPTNACAAAPRSLDECEFRVVVDGVVKRYAVESVVDTAYTCPHEGNFNFDEDWMVMKLKEKVDPRIKPYGINRGGRDLFTPGTEVIQVAKSNDWDGRKPVRRVDHADKHYGRCSVMYTYRSLEQAARVVETDCDNSPGSSGGGMFSRDQDPVLLGIVSTAYKPSCKDGTGKDGKGEYQKGCWAGVTTPVDRDLANALRAAAAGNAPPPRIPKPLPPRAIPAPENYEQKL